MLLDVTSSIARCCLLCSVASIITFGSIWDPVMLLLRICYIYNIYIYIYIYVCVCVCVHDLLLRELTPPPPPEYPLIPHGSSIVIFHRKLEKNREKSDFRCRPPLTDFRFVIYTSPQKTSNEKINTLFYYMPIKRTNTIYKYIVYSFSLVPNSKNFSFSVLYAWCK